MEYFGIYQGKVLDNDDPEKLGRCKINVPSVDGTVSSPENLPWAYYIIPQSTGVNRGSFYTPEIDDIVWVMYQNGLKENPVYVGSTYARGEKPLSDDEYFDTKVIYSDNNGVQVKRTKNELILIYNDSYVTLKDSGDINMYSTSDINITAEGNIKMIATRIDLNE